MDKTIFEKASEISNLIGSSEQEISIEIISGENRVSLREKKQQTSMFKKLIEESKAISAKVISEEAGAKGQIVEKFNL